MVEYTTFACCLSTVFKLLVTPSPNQRGEFTYAAPLRAPAPHPSAGFAGFKCHENQKKAWSKQRKISRLKRHKTAVLKEFSVKRTKNAD